VEAEISIQENPEDWSSYGTLGITLARLGRNDEAIAAAKKELELMPLSRDAILGAQALSDLQQIYTVCGEQEVAIDILEHLLSIPGFTNVNELRISPFYDPLREKPRFQKLLETAG